MLRFTSLLAAATLSACTTLWPYGEDAHDMLTQVLTSDSVTRKALWEEAEAKRDTPEGELLTGLLQSVPDQKTYDPVAASRRLEALLDTSPPRDIAAVARTRLADLKVQLHCREELAALRAEEQKLKDRLARLAEIERQMERGKR